MKAWRSQVQALRMQDARLAHVSDKALRALLEERPDLLKYNPDQERDEHGRWTSGGGGDVSHDDFKNHMDGRSGWERSGSRPNRWTHENGSRVLLRPDSRGKEYGGTVTAYSKDGALSNMTHVGGPSAPWMAGQVATGATMDGLLSTLERGGNDLRALNSKFATSKGYNPDQPRDADGKFGSGGGDSKEGEGRKSPEGVEHGWQVGLTRKDGSEVKTVGEARDALRSVYPHMAGTNEFEAALKSGVEKVDNGVFIVPLPASAAAELNDPEGGYHTASSSTHTLEAEMP